MFTIIEVKGAGCIQVGVAYSAQEAFDKIKSHPNYYVREVTNKINKLGIRC